MSVNGSYLPPEDTASKKQQMWFLTDVTGALERFAWNNIQAYAGLPACNLARDIDSINQCQPYAYLMRPIYVTVLTLIFSAIAAITAIGYMTWKSIEESNGGYTAMITQRDEQNLANGTTYTIPGDGLDPWTPPEEDEAEE